MSGTVILCPNPERDRNLAVTREAVALLRQAGNPVLVCPEFPGTLPADFPRELLCGDFYEALSEASLVVSLGGDGTIMHCARRLIGHNVPILGVNLGTVGFLAELERGELARLAEAAAGQYTLSPRMMLHYALERQGTVVRSGYVLNDVYLHGVGQMVRMTAAGDGRKILDFAGDGVAVASPTGSTAYSMSAGGPLVEPSAEAIILTPICPFDLTARSFVLAPEREVRITLGPLRGEAILSPDGERVEALGGDVLRVKRAEYKTLIAHVGDKAFYDIVFEKLGGSK